MSEPRSAALPSPLRRVLLIVAVILTAMFAFGGSAAAQDVPENQNDFQEMYHECREFVDTDPFTGEDGGARDRESTNFVDGALNQIGNTLASGACNTLGAIRHPGDAVQAAASNVASEFWGDPIGKFVDSLLEGNTQSLGILMTLWMKSPFNGADFSSSIEGIFNLTYYLQFAALAVSLMIAGVKLVAFRRQGLGQGLEDVGGSVGRFIIATTGIPVGVVALKLAGDALSIHWMNQALGQNPDESIAAITQIDKESGLGPIMALIPVGIALLGTAVQFIALVLRETMLIVIVGAIPIAAGASGTELGRDSWKRMTAFVTATLLFMPIASLAYNVVFWRIGAQGEQPDVLEMIATFILIGLIGFSLPMIYGFLGAAASSTITGGSAAGMAATGAAMAGGAAGIASAGAGALSNGVGRSISGGGDGGGAGGGDGSGATGAVQSYQGQYSPSGGGDDSGGGPGGGSGGAGPSGSDPSGSGGPSGAGAASSAGGGGGQSGGSSSGGGRVPSGAQMAGAVGRGAAGAVSGAASGVAVAARAAQSGAYAGAQGVRSTEDMISGAMGSYYGRH